MLAPQIMAILGVFGSAITLIFFFFTTRHKERMALIASGRDASVFSKDQFPGSSSLKFGILLVALGIGAFIGFLITNFTRMDESLFFPCIMVSGGLGLIYYYNLMSKKYSQGNFQDRDDVL